MHCPFTSKLHYCSHLRWSFYRYASVYTCSDSADMSLSQHTAGRFSFSNWFSHLSLRHCDLSQRRIQSDSSATSSIPAQIFCSPAMEDTWKELIIRSTKPPLGRIKLWTFWNKKSSWSSAILSSRDVFTEIPSVLELKAGFHKQKSRSSNQKRRAYDLVKTALPIPPTTPSLTFRLWSSEKQIVGVGSRSGRTKPVTKRTHGNVHCDWFIFPLPLPTPTI